MYPGSGRTFSTDVIPANFPAFVTSELLRRFKAKGRFKVNFLDTIDGRPIEVTWPIKSNQIKRLALFNRRVLNTEYSQKLANLWPSITTFWLTMVRFSRAQPSITGAIPWMQHKTIPLKTDKRSKFHESSRLHRRKWKHPTKLHCLFFWNLRTFAVFNIYRFSLSISHFII